jgi:gliding motility-associated protein GldM
MVASLTNFTQIQTDIRNSENDIITNLLRGQLEISGGILNNYKGIVNLDKTAYFVGEKVTGQVVLGRYDKNLVPDKVILNQKDVTNLVQDGQVILNMSAGSVGEKTIKGTIFFTEKGKQVPVIFESKYSVIPEPSSAVVSADKMNVVYRDLNNPISVSLPGVSDNNIRVSAIGGKLTGNNGKYMIKPGAAKTVTVNVSAQLSSGKKVSSKAIFRVKNIPPASGAVRGQFGSVNIPRSGLSNLSITAGFEDFVFDLKLTIKKFTIKVPGELSIVVQGNTLTAESKKLLNKAKRGDRVYIFDIEAVKSDGKKIPKVRDVSIKVTN